MYYYERRKKRNRKSNPRIRAKQIGPKNGRKQVLPAAEKGKKLFFFDLIGGTGNFASRPTFKTAPSLCSATAKNCPTKPR
jgi:hypothetical protein